MSLTHYRGGQRREPFHFRPRLWFWLFPGMGMSTRVPNVFAGGLILASLLRRIFGGRRR